MADERLIPAGIRDASTLAMNELIDRLGKLPLDQLLINLVDNVTAGALPHLAEQFHITGLEGWSLCTTDDERRSLIKRAVWLHRKKGTPWAVKEGLKSVGFDGATLDERLPALLYDGSQVYTGVDAFDSGSAWARFSINLDLGENRGVSVAETALIRTVVAEWKNERSHLDHIRFSAHTTDNNPLADQSTTHGHDNQDDVLPWGVRYDGSATYSSGRSLLFDGADDYSGDIDYTRSIPGDLLWNNEWDRPALDATATIADQQQIALQYNGVQRFEGTVLHGSDLPPYTDLTDQELKRHYLYDGRHLYGRPKCYDGDNGYNGSLDYTALMHYLGIHRIEHTDIVLPDLSVTGDLAEVTEHDALSAHTSMSDHNSPTIYHDGVQRFDGLFGYGVQVGSMLDATMAINMTWTHRYSGNRLYGGARRYNADLSYNGAYSFAPELTYAGVYQQQEVYA